jgi:Cu/Ag efflux pump CusA
VRSNRKLDNKDLGTVMQNIKEILVTVILPSGYYIDYGGAYKDQQQSFKELLLILASCLLVFCVIISISKFKSGFHPVVYFSFVFLEVIYYCFTNTP